MNLIELDGSTGEGGGQILRTALALALSMCTGQASARRPSARAREAPHAMSKRSRFITLVQAATKSLTSFSLPSALA
jgi:RNA 3'-terminal phosphate cyclase (ATP)